MLRLALLAALAFAGCSVDDVVAEECSCAAGCLQSCGDSGADGVSRGFCEGEGPLVLGEGACLGRLAEASFRHGICACRGLVTGAGLSSDSFDSREGAYRAPGAAGGSIGTGGGLQTTGVWNVRGSLRLYGEDGATTGEELFRVSGDVFARGPVAGSIFEVGRNAELAAGIRAQRLSVGGTLAVPEDQVIDVAEGAEVAGATERRAVQVDDACACDEALDVAGIVERHAEDNDNERIGLSPDEVISLPEARVLELPCGLYYLNRIVASMPLTIRASGRVALFVRGDVSAGDLSVEVEPGAELDLFIAGNLTAGSSLRVGRIEMPSQTRLYIGGGGTIRLPLQTLLAAGVYAPRSELVASGPLEIYGSVFVERLSAEDIVRSHYDESMLEVGDACEVPASCGGCEECPGTSACVDGTCGECRTSADCCSPLSCRAGRCEAALL